MAFYPSSLEKFPCLSGISRKNPRMKSEIPFTVPLQQTFSLVPPPSSNFFMFNQYNSHHFPRHLSLVGNNIEMIGTSSTINPFFTVPTFSLNDPHNTVFMKNLVKGTWTPKEDELLIELVERYGLKKWSYIAEWLNDRNGKQCRERWENHLRPNIKKDPWSEEEERMLIEAHKKYGNQWAKISKKLPGRTENMVKNHFYSTKRHKIVKMQKNKPTNSKGTPLQKYIMEIIAPKKEMKKSMTKINLMSRDHIDHENGEVNWNMRHNMAHTSRNEDYVPMAVQADEIASGLVMDYNTMEYENATKMDNFTPETLMKMEMEMMKMILEKP